MNMHSSFGIEQQLSFEDVTSGGYDDVYLEADVLLLADVDHYK